MCKNKVTAFILTALILLIALVPLFALKGAEFGGSDDAGSQIVESIQGNYEPWFTPVLETLIGGELPGEIELIQSANQRPDKIFYSNVVSEGDPLLTTLEPW